ncbi:MAG: DUF6159 family protein [Saprospiraceae bacterium]
MNVFSRLRAGWHLSMRSLAVIQDHPKLMVFPLISGAALMAILSTFGLAIIVGLGFFAGSDWSSFSFNTENNEGMSDLAGYALSFLYYLVNYFIVVYFNVALVHASREAFEGRRVSVRASMGHASRRIGKIFAWAAFAATVGTVINIVIERLGPLGGIVGGLLGFAWSIAVFFVVPVLAYEDVGPVQAVKRSAAILKEKWGESLAANVSFGLVGVVGWVLAIIGGVALILLDFVFLGIIVIIAGILLTMVAISAAKTVFLSAVYEHTRGFSPAYYERDTLDDVFVPK